jgi:hypothetical protein
MLRKAAVTLGGTLLPTLAIAAPDMQAKAFMDIYSSHCLKYLHDFGGLRKQLKAAPELAADKAAVFLKGARGKAWILPHPQGPFVLVLDDDKNLCAVYAKTMQAAPAQELFQKLVSNAPAPFRSEQKRNTTATVDGASVRTMAYEWTKEGAPGKPLFGLTVTTSTTSVAQGVATATIGR